MNEKKKKVNREYLFAALLVWSVAAIVAISVPGGIPGSAGLVVAGLALIVLSLGYIRLAIIMIVLLAPAAIAAGYIIT